MSSTNGTTTPKIGTHNGHFHADEALAVYLLRLLPEYASATLVRTRDPALLSTCTIVVDVGGVHDHSAFRYDHHQREFTTTFPGKATKLSSAGLVWMHYGKRIISAVTGLQVESAETELLYQKLYEDFVEAFDANDNGIAVYDPAALRKANIVKGLSDKGFSIASVVGRYNHGMLGNMPSLAPLPLTPTPAPPPAPVLPVEKASTIEEESRAVDRVKHPGKRSRAERNGASRRQYKKKSGLSAIPYSANPTPLRPHPTWQAGHGSLRRQTLAHDMSRLSLHGPPTFRHLPFHGMTPNQYKHHMASQTSGFSVNAPAPPVPQPPLRAPFANKINKEQRFGLPQKDWNWMKQSSPLWCQTLRAASGTPGTLNSEATPEIEDTRFLHASSFVGEQFTLELTDKFSSWLPARAVVAQAFNSRTAVHPSGSILVVPWKPEGVPWMDHLYALEKEAGQEGQVLYALFAENGEKDSKWRIRTVSLEPGSFENRKGLPEAWRGVRDEELSKVSGIPGCVFVHAGGFIGGNATFEGALEMAKKAVEA